MKMQTSKNKNAPYTGSSQQFSNISNSTMCQGVHPIQKVICDTLLTCFKNQILIYVVTLYTSSNFWDFSLFPSHNPSRTYDGLNRQHYRWCTYVQSIRGGV